MRSKIAAAGLLALATWSGAGAQPKGSPKEIVGGVDADRAYSCWDLNPISTGKCYRGLTESVKRGSQKCDAVPDPDKCREASEKTIAALDCAFNAARKPGPNAQKESAQQACLAPLK